ncbi:hypothetical protein [Sorangium sp. So ce861]|uniref:hypothetical protein n=1 Tax=Sorangium sp. So ce861 TaxID=3133323 RepID=UPI003F6011D0
MLDVIDDRVLGALRFVDATTGVAIRAPLRVTAPLARFIRNRTGAYAVTWAAGLDAHVARFQAPPSSPPLDSIPLSIAVSDPARRYLDRSSSIRLPRDADPARAAAGGSLFRPMAIPLYPSPIAPIDPGWAVVRASVRDQSGAALPGAYVRLRRASEPTSADPPLARGMADDRGEALIPVAGVPVTNWEADDTLPVLSTEIEAVLEVYHDANAGSPPDPDLIDSRRLIEPPDPHALSKTSVNVRLASGRELAVSVVITR